MYGFDSSLFYALLDRPMNYSLIEAYKLSLILGRQLIPLESSGPKLIIFPIGILSHKLQ